MLYISAPLSNPLYNSLYLAIFLTGIAMIVVGSALIPSSKRARKKIRVIYEIAGVRKEVTITAISQETGLDSEYIRKVITDGILYKRLYESLEDDLFVEIFLKGRLL